MGRDGIGREGMCVVYTCWITAGETNICLCGLPLNEEGVGRIWLCWYRWLAKSVGVVG